MNNFVPASLQSKMQSHGRVLDGIYGLFTCALNFNPCMSFFYIIILEFPTVLTVKTKVALAGLGHSWNRRCKYTILTRESTSA